MLVAALEIVEKTRLLGLSTYMMPVCSAGNNRQFLQMIMQPLRKMRQIFWHHPSPLNRLYSGHITTCIVPTFWVPIRPTM